MLKLTCFLTSLTLLGACNEDVEKQQDALTNTELIELVNLHHQALSLSEGPEKQELIRKIHELTGSEQFFIGDQIYSFGEPHIYISKEKEACMVEIVSFARKNSKTVIETEVSKNCRKYVVEVSRKFGYELEETK